jgi:hypothetical protein
MTLGVRMILTCTCVTSVGRRGAGTSRIRKATRVTVATRDATSIRTRMTLPSGWRPSWRRHKTRARTWYTAREVATALAVGVWTIRREIRLGRVPVEYPNGSRQARIRPEAIPELIERLLTRRMK